MNFESVFATVHDAVANGQIGTPVSVRLHAHFSEPQEDLAAACDAVLAGLRDLFPAANWTAMARRGASARQLSVLLQNDAGRTVFVTVTGGCTEKPQLSLLVIGNHGLLRLEGGRDFDGTFGKATFDTSLRTAIDASLAQKAAVSVSSA